MQDFTLNLDIWFHFATRSIMTSSNIEQKFASLPTDDVGHIYSFQFWEFFPKPQEFLRPLGIFCSQNVLGKSWDC